MSKGYNESDKSNDYIEQLQWRSQHRRRWPISYEPKWNYKIKYKRPETTLFGGFIFVISIIASSLMLTIFISSVLSNSEIELPGKLFLFVVIGITITILYFAIRDISKKKTHKQKSDN